MGKLKVVEKPDNISFETICEVLQQAHKANFDTGIILGVPNLLPDALERQVGDRGKCFVAIDGNRLFPFGEQCK